MDAEARLQSHEKAFEGLMSLTPASEWHPQNNEDQWRRKKQTKAEKRAAKKAKLDPSAQKSALDVHQENERKRKRDLDGDENDETNSPSQFVMPGQAVKTGVKKPKTAVSTITNGGNHGEAVSAVDEDAKRKAKQEKRHAKRERQKARHVKMREKAEAKLIKKKTKAMQNLEVSDSNPITANGLAIENLVNDDDSNDSEDAVNLAMIDPIDVDDLGDDEQQPTDLSVASVPAIDSLISELHDPDSTPTNPSDSSTFPQSSAVDPTAKAKLPKIDTEAARERFQAKLEALRAARNADGPDGRPARNRQELIESRRQKEEKRRQEKKRQRAAARQEEELEEAEAEAARLRGDSGSPNIFSPSRATPEHNFSFGRIAFDDGQQLNSSLSGLMDLKKRKGPQDPKTALEALERKQARLNGFDSAKKADIAEKDRWLNASKRVHGEKIKDDVSLLKKTLKRKEKVKAKSENEWKDRVEGVKKGQEMKQKKREENLQKRRDEKGNKGGKSSSKPGKKPVRKRPGFEGSFKASHRPKAST